MLRPHLCVPQLLCNQQTDHAFDVQVTVSSPGDRIYHFQAEGSQKTKSTRFAVVWDEAVGTFDSGSVNVDEASKVKASHDRR